MFEFDLERLGRKTDMEIVVVFASGHCLDGGISWRKGG